MIFRNPLISFIFVTIKNSGKKSLTNDLFECMYTQLPTHYNKPENKASKIEIEIKFYITSEL